MDDEIIAIRLASNQKSLPFILAFKLRGGGIVYAEKLVELLDNANDIFFYPSNERVGKPFYVEAKRPIANFGRYVGSILPFGYLLEDPLFNDPLLTLKRF